MADISLTPEQEAFLEECALEFSDRYADTDLDYKSINDRGIPPPPIMCPWYIRNRWGSGGGRYNRRDNRYNNHHDGHSQRNHYSRPY